MTRQRPKPCQLVTVPEKLTHARSYFNPLRAGGGAAVERGVVRLVEALLAAGADPNEADALGHAPLALLVGAPAASMAAAEARAAGGGGVRSARKSMVPFSAAWPLAASGLEAHVPILSCPSDGGRGRARGGRRAAHSAASACGLARKSSRNRRPALTQKLSRTLFWR